MAEYQNLWTFKITVQTSAHGVPYVEKFHLILALHSKPDISISDFDRLPKIPINGDPNCYLAWDVEAILEQRFKLQKTKQELKLINRLSKDEIDQSIQDQEEGRTKKGKLKFKF